MTDHLNSSASESVPKISAGVSAKENQEMEIREFHQRGGWHFARLEDGAVRIRLNDTRPGFDIVHIIPSAEWASIVAHVSSGR